MQHTLLHGQILQLHDTVHFLNMLVTHTHVSEHWHAIHFRRYNPMNAYGKYLKQIRRRIGYLVYASVVSHHQLINRYPQATRIDRLVAHFPQTDTILCQYLFSVTGYHELVDYVNELKRQCEEIFNVKLVQDKFRYVPMVRVFRAG